MPTLTEELRDQLVDAAVTWRQRRNDFREHGAISREPLEVAIEQLDLCAQAFEESLTLNGPVASGERDTSRLAALTILPKAASLRRQVLELIVAAGDRGVTCPEAEMGLGGVHQTISARINDLLVGGWVRDSGVRRRLEGRRPAIAWVLTEAGRGRLTT